MNPTILRISFQAMLGRRRGLMLLVLPAVLIALALALRLLTDPGTGYLDLISGLGLRLALPLLALLAATAVLGPEIDDGSIVYLLSKPVNRYSIAVSKYLAALGGTLLFGALALLVSGLVLDSGEPRAAVAFFVAGCVAGATYSALFIALCAFTKNAVVIGLLFAFLWESVLGNLLSGVRWLSPGAWGERVAAAIAPELGIDVRISLIYAVLASIVVIVGCVWYAGRRLSGFSLTGDD